MTLKPLILLVEDSPSQAEEYTAYLERNGYQVILAEDGIAALNMAQNTLPQAIILDVHLPGMDGFRVCHRLKRNPDTHHIPVVMLTEADTADDALQGLEVGADDYIPKDAFAVENLLTTLKTLPLGVSDTGELS